jgi:hypothetical protein
MADNKIILVALAVAAGGAILLNKKAIAATEYVCPYDGAVFATLAELQQYEMTNFPGQRISIDIKWS